MNAGVPKVAVVDNGYWGKNLVRNFHQLGALEHVRDSREAALTEATSKYGVKTTKDLEVIVKNDESQAVVISAPQRDIYDSPRSVYSEART